MTSWIGEILGSTFGAVIVIALTLLVPFVRKAISQYIVGSVQHRFDVKIEEVKSEFRNSEQQLADVIRSNEQQLRQLSQTAISLRTSRQVAVDARRLQAVEELWKAKVSIDRWKPAALFVSRLKLDAMYEAQNSGDRSIQTFAESLLKISGPNLEDLEDKEKTAIVKLQRPFLSPQVWTVYSAYSVVIGDAIAVLSALANGVSKFLKKEDVHKSTMIAALPEYNKYIEEYGSSGYHLLLPILGSGPNKRIPKSLLY